MSASNSRLFELAERLKPIIPVEKSAYYLSFYEEHFGARRAEPLNIVELGILNGGSTILFASYFPNARMLSIDINEPPPALRKWLSENDREGRVSVKIGSQSDKEFLHQSMKEAFNGEPVDLVIDDASHMYSHTRVSYEVIFPQYLKSGGWYLIEDWGCGYWPKWVDGNPDGQHGLPLLVKELVDELAIFDRTRLFQGARSLPVETEQASPFERMIIVPGLCGLLKKRI